MKRRLFRRAFVAFVYSCAASTSALAEQRTDDPVESARIQIGPLGLTPSIALTDLGIDSNVFHEAEQPKRDFTFTFSPGASAWLRAGRTRLSLDGRGDLVYFQRYSNQGSIGGTISGRYELRANRLTPWAAGLAASVRQRAGYEIDLRVRRLQRQVGAGVDIRVLANTQVTISAARDDLFYDATARYFGTNLRDALNRRSESADVALSHKLTPLTTFAVDTEAIRDRFMFSPERDSTSTRLRAGLDFAPLALISGRVRVGYRKFNAAGGVPDFAGIVASVDAAYTLLGRTRLEVIGQREFDYSFDLGYPYYLITGAHVTVTPRLSTHWDIQGRFGRQQLAYRQMGMRSAGAARVDRYAVYGAGIGYRLGASARISANVDRERRRSEADGRDYDGYRLGVSTTFGR